MSRPADQPESNSTLPLPELNPLVNPLLGQNMGRWAEVYFTSPPEKREEAVLNLLRELEQDASRAANNAVEMPETVPAGEADEERLAQAFTPAGRPQETTQEVVPCPSCGANNPLHQKFCGQCGTLLRGDPVDADPARRGQPSPLFPPNPPAGFASPASAPQFSYERQARDLPYEETQTSIERELKSETYFTTRPRELHWLHDVEAPKLMPEYEPVPYRYRIYVGAAIALMIGALVYIAWRGTQVPSGGSHALPLAAPAANTQPPTQSQTPPLPGRGSPDTTGSQNGKTNLAAAPDRRLTNQPPNKAPAHVSDATGLNKPSDLAPVPGEVPRQPAPPASPQDNGTRELALAQGYLSNAPGRVRDSAEAAKWLWQAVRKENATASLILSDLYLRGDGVPKNCDQGRLLLNAAGRRGAPGAGERIRNLQAFGCQ